MYCILCLSLVLQNTVSGTRGLAGGFWSVHHRDAGKGQPLYYPCPSCHHHATRHQVSAAHCGGRIGIVLLWSSLPSTPLAALGEKREGITSASCPCSFFRNLHTDPFLILQSVVIPSAKLRFLTPMQLDWDNLVLDCCWGCLAMSCTCPHSHPVPPYAVNPDRCVLVLEPQDNEHRTGNVECLMILPSLHACRIGWLHH